MANRLGLVSIVVPEYESAIAFFADGLGFELIKDEDQGEKRWVVMRPMGGGSDIVLARASTPEQISAIGNQTGGRVGFFLFTDDFATTHMQIVKAGGLFKEQPRDEIYGRVAVFADPFGNLWDLLQPSDIA